MSGCWGNYIKEHSVQVFPILVSNIRNVGSTLITVQINYTVKHSVSPCALWMGMLPSLKK